MARCPNCDRETARTSDWVCQWCGYPLLTGSYKNISKTFRELKEERQSQESAGAVRLHSPQEEARAETSQIARLRQVLRPAPESPVKTRPKPVSEHRPEPAPKDEPPPALPPPPVNQGTIPDAETMPKATPPSPPSPPEPVRAPQAEVKTEPPPSPAAKPVQQVQAEPEPAPVALEMTVTDLLSAMRQRVPPPMPGLPASTSGSPAT